MAGMTIGELARRAGVGVQTVRYYQRRGLIAEPPRRARGFREYSDEMLATLCFIRRAKGLGFTLKEIADLVKLRAGRRRDRGGLVEVLDGKAEALERKRSELEVAIRALRRLRDAMSELGTDERWALLDPETVRDEVGVHEA